MRHARLRYGGMVLAAALVLAPLAGSARAGTRPRTAAEPPGGAVAVEGADFIDGVLVATKIASTGLFQDVSYSSGPRAVQIPLDTLDLYPAVMVYGAAAFADPVGLGNTLADYVDQGHQLVLAGTAFEPENGNEPRGLGGRIVTGGYLPFTTANGYVTNDGPHWLVKDRPLSPLLAGVGTFSGGSGSWRSDVAVTRGSSLVAHWNDAARTPLEAVRVAPSGGAVIGLNMSPRYSDISAGGWDSRTDGARLMADALLPLSPTMFVPTAVRTRPTDAYGARVSFRAAAFRYDGRAISPGCAPGSGTHFGFGTTPVTCRAVDPTTRLTSTRSFPVTVTAFRFSGFLSPRATRAPAGSVLQVRFALRGQWSYITDPRAVVALQVVRYGKVAAATSARRGGVYPVGWQLAFSWRTPSLRGPVMLVVVLRDGHRYATSLWLR